MPRFVTEYCKCLGKALGHRTFVAEPVKRFGANDRDAGFTGCQRFERSFAIGEVQVAARVTRSNRAQGAGGVDTAHHAGVPDHGYLGGAATLGVFR